MLSSLSRLAFVVFALTGANAFADTYLNRVLDMHAQARVPANDELTGWFSGRCYRRETPMQPFGAILVGKWIDVGASDPGNGPAFPSQPDERHSFNILGRGNQGTQAPADHFDVLDDEKIAFVEGTLARLPTHWTQTARGGWQVAVPEGNLVLNARLFPSAQGVEPATNPGYQVAKMTALRDYPPYRAGDLFAACYFFKQVR